MGIRKVLLTCLASTGVFLSFSQEVFQEYPSAELGSAFRFPDAEANEVLDDLYLELSREERLKLKKTVLIGSSLTRNLNMSSRVILSSKACDYLDSLKNVILKDFPAVKDLIRIYIADDVTLNAFATINNTIYVNVGLLARVKTEGQLVYILCHEIMHIVNQHIIKEKYELEKVIDTYQTDDLASKNEIVQLKIHQISQDFELESDHDGFLLFNRLDYAESEALEVMELLKLAQAPFTVVPLEPRYFFMESSYFEIRKLDWLERKMVDSTDLTKKESAIISTHPSVEKRITELEKLVDQSNLNSEIEHQYFDVIQKASVDRLPEIMVKDADFISLFLHSSLKYQNGNYDQSNTNDLCYAIQGLYLGKFSNNLMENRLSNSAADSLFTEFYLKNTTITILEWTYKTYKQIQNETKLEFVQDYISAFERNVRNAAYVLSDKDGIEYMKLIGDTAQTIARPEYPPINLTDVEFYLSPVADLSKNVLNEYNVVNGKNGYENGRIAIINPNNYYVKKNKRYSNKFEYEYEKTTRFEKNASEAAIGLQEEYSDILALLPQSNSYLGQDFGCYKLLQSWLQERFSFENYQYVSYFEKEMKDLHLTQGVDYLFTNLSIVIGSAFSIEQFVFAYFSPFIIPLYTPMLVVNTILGGKRCFMLSVIFDLKTKNLVFWDRRSFTEPTTSAELYGQYEGILNSFNANLK